MDDFRSEGSMIERIARELRYGALTAALFAALVAPAGVGAQGAGVIAGVVTTKATRPAPLRLTVDQKVCGNELPDEAVVVNADAQLANAVVVIVGLKAKTAPAESVVMNEKCRFVPRVQVARPNVTVRTSSKDPVLHTTNAQQEGGRTLFNVGLPIPGMSVRRPIAGAGLVRLFCNTHPWMRGWIVVTDEVTAITGADGRFTIADVPPGAYELRIWHETLKAPSQKITVRAAQTSELAIEMQ